MDQTTCDAVAFGRFRLDPARRALLADGQPVTLSSRGFDILQLLVEHRDRIVTKDEILRRVWRGTIVEENNLAVQISALRRALADAGDGAALIATVPGQGYRFVGRVEAPAPPQAAPLPDVNAALPPAAAPPRRWPLAAASAAFAGIAALGAILVLNRAPKPARPPAPPRLSIAVLPFRNLGIDRNDDYLADAVSDDLTTDLSHIPGSVVIARESADSFRGRGVPTPEIGRALNVRYLLEGSVRGADGQYSINAQLIEADTGAHLWAQRFEVPRARVSDTQSTIVGQIASALNVQLVDLASRHAVAGPAGVLDQLYHARSILERSDTYTSMTTAQALLERARAQQPQNVDVLSDLGRVLVRKVDSYYGPDQDRDRAEAREVIAAAASLAPADPDVMSERAFLLAGDGGCAEALKVFQAVLAMYGSSVLARSGQAHCLTALGRNADAAEAWRKLLQIDPFGPSSQARYYQLGRALLFLDRPDEALTWLERSEIGDQPLARGTGSSGRREWGRLYQIAALELSGKQGEAERAYRAFDAIWPHRTTWRLESETNSAEVRASPAFQSILSALRKAGMPGYADEHEDENVAEADGPQPDHRPFDPTPITIAGQRFIDTAQVALLRQHGRVSVLDVGRCDSSVPGAIRWRNPPQTPLDAASAGKVLASDADRLPGPLIVMGDGAFGWDSYNSALILLRSGFKNVQWYRGGEEAWARANLPHEACSDSYLK